MPNIFDAHCHIAFLEEPTSFLAERTGEHANSNIAIAGRLLCGVGPADWNAVLDAAAAWPETVGALGLHPWRIGDADAGWPDLLDERLAADPALWLGEAGLDGLKTNLTPFDRQQEAFREQLRLARKHNRPVNLHCVKAWPELAAILDEAYLSDGPGRPFIVHSFAGPDEHMRALADRGAYFTVGPLFSRRDSRRDRGRVARMPANRLLLESDAFIAPSHDDAAGLAHALAWLADCRGVPTDALAAVLSDNAKKVFNHD